MDRCPSCPAINRCIPADGPAYSDVLFIGDSPNKDDDRKGQVFMGKAGDELNRGYLPICNLRRENVIITNAIKCLPHGTGKLDPKKTGDLDMLRSCAETHLYKEIQQVRPKVLVPMGSFACRAIDPNINLELQHGMPVQTPHGIAFPMYHPAGGIHEPKKMLLIRTDWTRLNKYLKGRLNIPRDPFEGSECYEHIDNPALVRSVLSGYDDMPMACDTESTRKRQPFCLTFSTEPGTGFLIRAEDEDSLAAFQAKVENWRGPILFHNWLYDRDPVRLMGLRFRDKQIIDTMIMAFHLGNIPQGLKAIAYRLLGMTMEDFDDVVTPHSKELVLEYYRQCMSEEWIKPEPELVRDPKGQWKVYKAQGFDTKLRRFFSDYTKNPDKDVFKMWEDNWENLHDQVQERMGEWPGKCISHTPFENVITYACRDSDSTLRAYPLLKAMQRQMRRKPQEHWLDAA